MQRDPKEIKIYLSRILPAIGADLLREQGFIVNIAENDEPRAPSKLIEIAQKHNALITVSGDKLDKSFLEKCRHLKIISQFAAGYDNIDLVEATRLGIPVCNTPDAMTEATADIAFGLMIACSRKMFYMHKTIARNEWGHFRPTAHLGIELKNKTVGIFGLGRIGMAMARRCKGAYDMKIIYCNRQPNAEAEKNLDAQRVSFDQLLRESDVLSVHSVLSDDTRGIFDRAAFGKMKKSAIFINTSRGSIHHEEDLIQALSSGQIWGAGLDVTNPEPMESNNPLLGMENVAVLPHIGSATVEARNEMSRMAARNIIEFYKTGIVPNLLNPEYLHIRRKT